MQTVTFCLLATGAVMVYSASSAEYAISAGDPALFLKRYVGFGLVGLVVLFVCARCGLALARRLAPLLFLAACGLCLAVLVPGIGVEINGARRWIGAGALQFQPSELLKFSLVIYGAHLLARARPERRTLGGAALPFLIAVALAAALVMAQPDMGTTLVICAGAAALLFAAGIPIRQLAVAAAVLALAALVLAIAEPYRRARLTAFLDPFHDPGGAGFQTIQALVAIGSGGPIGVGLGESVQKVFYLPEAHTDMILAVIGEELGLLGLLGLLLLYLGVVYCGLRIARSCRDEFTKLACAGVTATIGGQALLNFAAVLGLAPLTGVPLPLVSYGSSSLVTVLAGIGLLLDAARREATAAANTKARPRRRQPPTRPALRVIEGAAPRERAAGRAARSGSAGAVRRTRP
ncbi:putative lipid II flippase FtsW [Thermoleophilum album]|uniref:putative lipid II flippase FtsW n=1 Tax=Thermoleophilum album TaxID=29539 RepID=UPI00115F8608|nr:putative lipid II flippase FtsW [Thermoleophilum album]